MRHNYLFTSESVTEGHPDKIADQISDGILDAIIAQDKYARVACETILTTGIAFVAGEISTKAYVEIPDIIREVIKDVGYCDAAWGFDSTPVPSSPPFISNPAISPWAWIPAAPATRD